MSGIDGAVACARENKERHLDEFRELVRIPSISTLSEHKQDVLKACDWLVSQLKSVGMARVEVVETPGHPIIFAEGPRVEGAPTVLVYGHYDVQPVDPLNEWESGPFDADIRGDYMFGRGASDMKGQIFAQIKSVEAWAKSGGVPVNLKYLIEGEEEIGSPNLGKFIADYKEQLKCDFVLNCDCGIHEKDTPAITYSLRGLAYFELEIVTAKKDLHSGLFGGSVRNPIHLLAELIAKLHDEQGRVTLPGFYDKVRTLDEDERELLKRVPYSDDKWKELSGSEALFGEEGYTAIERIGARPTLEINGIWGGFTGEGAKTVLPARAHAKLSCRLVPNQEGSEIFGMIDRFVKEHLPQGVTYHLHQHSCGPGAVMNWKSDYMKAAAAALEDVFGKQPIFKREGGSVPIVGMLQQSLGVDSVMLGFALPDDGIHGPNERQYVPNFFRGIETYVRFLGRLAKS